MNPYHEEHGVSIYLGDALEVMESLGREVVDVVVTSPPYNMGLVPGGNGRGMYRPGASNKAGRFRDGYDGTNDDALPYEAYCEWQRQALGLMFDAARSAVFYNHRPRVEHGRLREPLDGDYGLADYPDVMLRQRIIIDRGTGIDVNLRNFCTRGEYLLLFVHEGFQLVSHSASGMGDVWRLGMDTSGVDHPAPFPLSLPTRCLEASGAASVLDPFMGSGTTLLAARNLGRRGIGVEKNERYCEVAARRLAQGVLNFGASA